MQLSIIIPAYNCADTIENAVASAAFCPESEIIIIDDGSTDSTSEKISQLKLKYHNVKSIRQENSGPAAARNNGIKSATGKYIMFIDSDDTFEADALKKVLSALEKDTDMLIFGFRQNFMSRAEDKIYSLSSPFSVDGYYKSNLLNQVWNKAYRRDFLVRNNICFKDYRYGEDRIFNAEILRLSPVVKSIPDVLYNYNIDKSVSLISGYIPEKFDACKVIHAHFSELCSDKNVSNYMFLKNVLSCMTVLFADNCRLSPADKKNEINKIITDPVVISAMKEKQASAVNNIIRKIILSGNVTLNYIFAYSVGICQKYFLPVFLKFRK